MWNHIKTIVFYTVNFSDLEYGFTQFSKILFKLTSDKFVPLAKSEMRSIREKKKRII